MKKGLLDSLCQHMPKHCGNIWSKESCAKQALLFNTATEWQKNDPKSYAAASRNGWLEECSSHLKPLKEKWSKQKCLSFSAGFTSRIDWQNGHTNSYTAAIRNGWLDECCVHMPALWSPRWDKKACIKDASLYPTISDWQENSPSSVQSARRNGWMKECCGHMKRDGNHSRPEKALFEIIKRVFPDARKLMLSNKNPDFVGKRFELDIYIPSLQKGIEFNGDYWHSLPALERKLKRKGGVWSSKTISLYHQLKESFFNSFGIGVIFIQEKNWTEDQESCIKKIMEFLS